MYRRLIYPLLARLDAESAHNLTLDFLHQAQAFPSLLNVVARASTVPDSRLEQTVCGLHFANPLGLAAGIDKNARSYRALAAFGFGHVEIGTVTPRPQPGRDRPRIFRLPEDDALINRVGFPSHGAAAVAPRLIRANDAGFVLGVNIGANSVSVQNGTAIDDYITGIKQLYAPADYLTINISSPNTPGLRLLQGQEMVSNLLSAVFTTIGALPEPPPVFVKIAPDLSVDQLTEFLDAALAHPISGIIATNTALFRPDTLRGAARGEQGGLSGKPLRDASTTMIRAIREHTGGRIPIIGVGGVFTAADAIAKMKAGASLVQLYTGFVYQGPASAHEINRGILAYLDRHNIPSVADIVGRDDPD